MGIKDDRPPSGEAGWHAANVRNQQSRWLMLIAATAIGLYICWQMLRPFLDVLIWSAMLVIVFRPVNRLLIKWTRRPVVAAALSCVFVFLALLLPLAFVLLAVGNQLTGVIQNLPRDLDSFFDPEKSPIKAVLTYVGQFVDLESFHSPEKMRAYLQEMAGPLTRQTLGLVGNAFEASMKIVFILFAMFYLFLDGHHFAERLRATLPLRPQQADAIFQRTREVIDASVYGVTIISVIQGTLAGLAFWFLGLPSPLLWGLVMIVCSFVPMIGSALVWGPAALYLLAVGEWGRAIALTVWGTVVIGAVDNLLRPKLVGGKAKLHDLFIFFSVLGGLQLFGIVGLVLGPVVLAVTLALLEVIREGEPATAVANNQAEVPSAQ